MNSKSLLTYVLFLITTLCSSQSSLDASHHFNSTTLNVTSSNSLDRSLENFALKALTGRHGMHTGLLYRAILPENLSGIEVSVVRLTGKSLWNSGAMFRNVHIPPRSVSVPPARRVAVVYQDLGNWSAHWYTVPGYRLIASVLGFRVLDVSNLEDVKEISLRSEKSIEIEFRDLVQDPDEKLLSRVRCVRFKAKTGELVHVNRMNLPGVCYGSSQGDYSVVVPMVKKRKKKLFELWWLWMIGFTLAFGLLGFLGYVGAIAIKVLRSKKIQVMEREAEDGEAFESRWVGGSKMPSAPVTRTQPESGLETVP